MWSGAFAVLAALLSGTGGWGFRWSAFQMPINDSLHSGTTQAAGEHRVGEGSYLLRQSCREDDKHVGRAFQPDTRHQAGKPDLLQAAIAAMQGRNSRKRRQQRKGDMRCPDSAGPLFPAGPAPAGSMTGQLPTAWQLAVLGPVAIPLRKTSVGTG